MKAARHITFGLVAVLALGATLTAGASTGGADRIEGNVGSCPDGNQLVKVDPVRAGAYEFDGGTIVVSVDGKAFNWSLEGEYGVTSVYVKGGPDTALYRYGYSQGDSGLKAPTSPVNGRQTGLSHILFCGQEMASDNI
ncbi:MAG: hypothetical protein OEX04_02520 [Acidimicrobiia bacterium]|nr:hypothetical protein [Acidimicrobiia bacterium]MDH4306328.1 hypothetical protein [Acidimicrobiia bacterium]MDH5295491.1 hypothetical protein [Acidimicrobiia bacterium]